MMEKEDEGAEEEDTEDDGSDVKGEPDDPMGTAMAQAQASASQPPCQEDEIRDTLMEDTVTLPDVTGLSNSSVLP